MKIVKTMQFLSALPPKLPGKWGKVDKIRPTTANNRPNANSLVFSIPTTMRFLCMAILAFTVSCATAQSFDTTFLSHIRTVRLHLAGLPLSYPVIDLGSQLVLEASFDDLEADLKNYTFSLTHCNADWSPSRLSSFEYVDGFTEDRIRDIEPAFNTTIPYTHYRFFLPNDQMRFTKSGQYILTIYEEEDEKRVVATRRFVVVEPLVQVVPKMTYPAQVAYTRTHQELDFKVLHKGFPIASPQQEVRAAVLQNGRWQTAVQGIAPLFYRGDEITFDYQDKIVFPAGKEFRYFDLRSLRTRMDGIEYLEDYDGDYHATLIPDLDRSDKAYLTRQDINGNFVAATLDGQDQELESDYVDVAFTLALPFPLPEGEEVYVFGALSDWQLTERCRLRYDDATGVYRGKQLLKQGFYNYIYAVKKPGNPLPDTSALEGDWHETENDYLILIYYRPFGARYDRVIAAHSFKSVQ